MKKLKTYVTILVMLVSTVGIVIEKHYSMGDLYDIGFFSKAEQCCETGCGCCEEDAHLYRLQEEFSPEASIQIEKFEIEITILPNMDCGLVNAIFITQNKYPLVHAPPGAGNDCSQLQSFRC